ncbi:hypothetical protein A8990_109112 [Paenibacillus taihuensis]|uniref:Pirin N-terminal domain-containing protein n=1 Tax=Paenibacillus taihuensis TaxID=1156355 RepID=A0A3D9S9H9_9BACL|nr:pirin family protein [Paenibacillus taihuensis]REE87466.1 hypothetical protein A8990_109112 [Paenibacillus taihuensis]
MKITVYEAHEQGIGQFDNGKIIEQKPIAFSHEPTAVKRIGPLFYWAWGYAEKGGIVPLHPHQGFEIMSYVLNGNLAHKDTLGTKSTVGPGGIQLMQTGSGMYHEEESFGDDVEGFQIWFEPNLRETMRLSPSYQQFENQDFPVTKTDGNTVKTIIGHDSPVTLMTDVKMWDLKQAPSSSYRYQIPSGYSLAILVIRGDGVIIDSHTVVAIDHKDFVVIDAESRSEVIFHSGGEGMQTIIIEVPTIPNYSLYPKG